MTRNVKAGLLISCLASITTVGVLLLKGLTKGDQYVAWLFVVFPLCFVTPFIWEYLLPSVVLTVRAKDDKAFNSDFTALIFMDGDLIHSTSCLPIQLKHGFGKNGEHSACVILQDRDKKVTKSYSKKINTYGREMASMEILLETDVKS